MKAIEELADKIRLGRAAGLIPKEWETLVETALAEVTEHWETEKAFRQRTGSSDKWCREHFGEYENVGLARKTDRGRREWHRHARMSKRGRLEPRAIKSHIVDTFHRRAS